MTYLVAYDIECHRVRARLAKYLEKCGIRLQKSVFAVRLERFRYKSFMRKLQHIAGADGKVAVFRLCAGCSNSSVQLGAKEPTLWVF